MVDLDIHYMLEAMANNLCKAKVSDIDLADRSIMASLAQTAAKRAISSTRLTNITVTYNHCAQNKSDTTMHT